jgi:SAM-dependent methyltransferase
MSRIEWRTGKTATIGEFCLPGAEALDIRLNGRAGYDQIAGIRRGTGWRESLKPLLYPLFKFHDDLLVDGFIERAMGRWMRSLLNESSVLLEIGCGDMSLRKYVPDHLWYNAVDLAFSEFQLRRALRSRRTINLAFADATHLPIDSDSVTLIVSTEVFQHIPDMDKAIEEMGRVLASGGRLICSIANVGCYKYARKGRHGDMKQHWTFDQFKDLMLKHGFRAIEGYMKGCWVPLPGWLTKRSYQLPIASQDEYYNTNFFYMFEVKK